MKRVLMTGVVALVGVMILSDVAEARRFGRRRSSGSTNCSTCNTGMQQGQAQMNQNMGPGGQQYAPGGQYGPTNAPPPPNAQTFTGPNGQPGNTTFYRGQPQPAPNSQSLQGNANVNANSNLGTNQPAATLQGQGNAGANIGANQSVAPQNAPSVQGKTNVQGNTNLKTNINP